ncbi:hypothetical protein GN958_ATG09302 [Phytophthora infestans]|uniref:Uncharacterized protein n=1 Tax=Phytophthora infestans TaxID=4787 RepID=A0A8S9UR26_PHYIN|nr:hypothetical protein GN958_ATG09302 [Phytophthora infestans]
MSMPTIAQSDPDQSDDDQEAKSQWKDQPKAESTSSAFRHLERSIHGRRSFRAEQLPTQDTCIDMTEHWKQRGESSSPHGRSFSRLTGTRSRPPGANLTGIRADPTATRPTSDSG